MENKWHATVAPSSASFNSSFNFLHLLNVSLEIQNHSLCYSILLHAFLAFIPGPSYIITIKGQLKWKINLILNERLVIVTQCGMGSFLLAYLA